MPDVGPAARIGDPSDDALGSAIGAAEDDGHDIRKDSRFNVDGLPRVASRRHQDPVPLREADSADHGVAVVVGALRLLEPAKAVAILRSRGRGDLGVSDGIALLVLDVDADLLGGIEDESGADVSPDGGGDLGRDVPACD